MDDVHFPDPVLQLLWRRNTGLTVLKHCCRKLARWVSKKTWAVFSCSSSTLKDTTHEDDDLKSSNAAVSTTARPE